MTPWLLVWAMVCLPATSRNPVRVISRAKVLTSARRGSGSVEGVGAKTLRRDMEKGGGRKGMLHMGGTERIGEKVLEDGRWEEVRFGR
eukprot:104613-Amorphochlora_amoeboformis.AAC.1